MNSPPVTRRLRGVGLMMAMVLGCAGPIIDIAFEIVVHQINGQVSFDFYWEDTRLWFTRKRPADVYRFSIHRAEPRQTLWEVVSHDQRHTTASIVYGTIPDGFVQRFPERGPAPPLQANEKYDVEGRAQGLLDGVASFVYRAPK